MKSKVEKDQILQRKDTTTQIREWEEEWYWDEDNDDYDCSWGCPNVVYSNGFPQCQYEEDCPLRFSSQPCKETIGYFMSLPGKWKFRKQHD